MKNDFWGISALWAPIVISFIADCASVFFTAKPLNQSISAERNSVADERATYAIAGDTLATTLFANAPERSSTDGLTNVGVLTTIKNGKPQNTTDTINARRLPPFSRVGQYFIPFMVTLLSAAIAAVRQSNLGDNGNMGSTISKEIEDFISHNGNLTFNGTIPGPFNLSGTLTP